MPNRAKHAKPSNGLEPLTSFWLETLHGDDTEFDRERSPRRIH
jgi:hypothetical protein